MSSTMPLMRLKPAISVTPRLKRMIDSGASTNHHGTPRWTLRYQAASGANSRL